MKIRRVRDSINGMLSILFWFFLLMLNIYVGLPIFFWFYGLITLIVFFAGVLGFTTMGLAVNAEIVTP